MRNDPFKKLNKSIIIYFINFLLSSELNLETNYKKKGEFQLSWVDGKKIHTYRQRNKILYIYI